MPARFGLGAQTQLDQSSPAAVAVVSIQTALQQASSPDQGPAYQGSPRAASKGDRATPQNASPPPNQAVREVAQSPRLAAQRACLSVPFGRRCGLRVRTDRGGSPNPCRPPPPQEPRGDVGAADRRGSRRGLPRPRPLHAEGGEGPRLRGQGGAAVRLGGARVHVAGGGAGRAPGGGRGWWAQARGAAGPVRFVQGLPLLWRARTHQSSKAF